MIKHHWIKGLCIICFLIGISITNAQEVDLENLKENTLQQLKKNPFKISGGVSASSVFYSSNAYTSRAPFTYFINGNLNIGIYNWTMPISYNLTNQGSQLGYDVPFKFNRLSIAPKYKWVKAYIGDASMTFSRYTYSGLLFTGGGLELTPNTPLKVAVMAGRLNKAIEDNGNPNTIPAYKRMGYGTHLKWEKEKYKLGLIGFYAKDDIYSLSAAPDEKGVLPQENLVLSLIGAFKIDKNLELFVEYANSALVNDLRSNSTGSKKGISSLFLKTNSSLQSHSAYNTGANLRLKKGTIGIKYERIDPEYRTLGAYYFNNDLENITLNTSFNLLKDKVSLSTNIGRQRDNLEAQKIKQTSRWVGSANINIKASEKLMIATNYSNFTMFTNNRLNQFDNINNNPLQIQQPRDSISYRQISQNANVNISYAISNTKEKNQNINFNYSLNDMVNKENGIVRKGGISRFHNTNINYTIGFPEKKLNIATSFNFTHSYAASQISTIWGPNVMLSKSFLEKDKLKTSFSASFNKSNMGNTNSNVLNMMLGANYTPLEKHNFNANIIQMMRNSNQEQQPNINEFTATVGYTYSF